MSSVWIIHSCFERESWIEGVFSSEEGAIKEAKALAKVFFDNVNYTNDPELKMFNFVYDNGDRHEYCYGRSEWNSEPLVKITRKSVK